MVATIAALFALATGLVAVAPARAEGVATTTLTLTATPRTVEYAGVATLSGRLTSMEVGVADATLLVFGSTDGTTWAELATMTTGADGAFGLAVQPAGDHRETLYRVDYAGSADDDAATAQVAVAARAALTAPAVPLRAGRGSAFQVTGSLRPHHEAGTQAVLLKAYHRESGAWVLRQTHAATLAEGAGGSVYRAAVKLGAAGKWRLRASTRTTRTRPRRRR